MTRLRRLFVDSEVQVHSPVRLDSEQIHRITRVLRLQAGHTLNVFDPTGREYRAQLVREGRDWSLLPQSAVPVLPESPLQVVLGQAIARGDRMDFTLQKSAELGVAAIQPLITERSQFVGDAARNRKRAHHWQRIVVQACEQCGRASVPPVHEPVPLPDWLSQRSGGWILQPESTTSATEAAFDATDPALLIGPEGGFSDAEIRQALSQGFVGVSLGPRTLRTETTALVALTILQLRGGDLQ